LLPEICYDLKNGKFFTRIDIHFYLKKPFSHIRTNRKKFNKTLLVVTAEALKKNINFL